MLIKCEVRDGRRFLQEHGEHENCPHHGVDHEFHGNHHHSSPLHRPEPHPIQSHSNCGYFHHIPGQIYPKS